jgi:hypothetical protein
MIHGGVIWLHRRRACLSSGIGTTVSLVNFPNDCRPDQPVALSRRDPQWLRANWKLGFMIGFVVAG